LKAFRGFLSPLKYILSVEFEPATLGSNDKHANRYTTESITVWSYLVNFAFIFSLIKLVRQINFRSASIYTGKAFTIKSLTAIANRQATILKSLVFKL
jgi:hypothetical protein